MAGDRRAILVLPQFRIFMGYGLAAGGWRGKGSVERSRDCSLGDWNPNSANH